MTLAFRFRAARSDGSIERGAVRSTDRDGALRQLQARGLFVVSLSGGTAELSRIRMSAADLASGLSSLATLLEGGLPMRAAVAAFEGIAPPSWGESHSLLQERIAQG